MSAQHNTLVVHTLPVGQMAANCYFLEDSQTKKVVIIDPGDDAEYISDRIQRSELKPTKIIATHGHFDHIMAVFTLTNIYHIPFYMNTKDEFLLSYMQESARHYLKITTDPSPAIDGPLLEGELIPVGKYSIVVMETPGHTPGSVCLYIAKANILIGGDLLFKGGGVGRTDFSYSSAIYIKSSIQKILQLPTHTVVYPGHGESTTIGELKECLPIDTIHV